MLFEASTEVSTGLRGVTEEKREASEKTRAIRDE